MGDFRNVSKCPSSFRTVIYTEKVNFLTLPKYFKVKKNKSNDMKQKIKMVDIVMKTF